MVSLDAAQERNYRAGLSVARNQAEAVRITFAKLTESNGRVLANDGAAFADDYATKRPGWAEGLPASQRREIYRMLRTSLDLPHDGVGNNGGSTGDIQQLSQDYVGLRFPGKTWGYGTIAQTMDPVWSAIAFRDRLVVTDNREYAGLDFDPIAADVLRVQQPLVSERESDNYGDAQVARANAIVAQLSTDEPSEPDWIDMADQAALDKYKGEIVAAVVSALSDDLARLRNLDPIIREIYNRADWTNTRTEGTDTRLAQLDPVIRETYNRAEWVNQRTVEMADAFASLRKLLEADNTKGA